MFESYASHHSVSRSIPFKFESGPTLESSYFCFSISFSPSFRSSFKYVTHDNAEIPEIEIGK